MEKLIKLLNEYDKTNNYLNKWFRDEYGRLDREYGWSTVASSCWKVISKDYGFIKWLVDNDKIDISNYEYKIGVARIGENNMDEWYDEYSDYEKTLMLLTIQDEPIEFLISILK